MYKLDLGQGRKPDIHQIEGATFLLERFTGYLQYSTGVGKTITLILAILYALNNNMVSKIVIVCPKNAVISFLDDISDYTKVPHSYIDTIEGLGGFITGNIPVAIVSYNFIDKYVIETPNYRLGIVEYSLDKQLLKFFKKTDIMLIFDEFHTLKNPDTNVSKYWHIVRKLCTYVYGMTATGYKSSIYDLYQIIKFLDPSIFGTKKLFTEKYVNEVEIPIGKGRTYKEIRSLKNLDALKANIQDIAKVFRPVMNEKHLINTIPISDSTLALYLEYAKGYLSNTDKKLSTSAKMVGLQKTVDAEANKLAKMLELVNTYCPTKGILIYFEYKESLAIAEAYLKEHTSYKIFSIDGDTSMKIRKQHKDCFQKDPKNQIGLLMPAGNQSLNLQATNHLIIYNIPYSAGGFDQLKGRIVRYYSEYDVFYLHYLIVEDTIDTYRYERLQQQVSIVDAIFDCEELTVKLPTFDSVILKKLRKKLLWKTGTGKKVKVMPLGIDT